MLDVCSYLREFFLYRRQLDQHSDVPRGLRRSSVPMFALNIHRRLTITLFMLLVQLLEWRLFVQLQASASLCLLIKCISNWETVTRLLS